MFREAETSSVQECLYNLCPLSGEWQSKTIKNANLYWINASLVFERRHRSLSTIPLQGSGDLVNAPTGLYWVSLTLQKHNPTPSFVFVAVELDMSLVTQWRMDSAWSQSRKVPTIVKDYWSYLIILPHYPGIQSMQKMGLNLCFTWYTFTAVFKSFDCTC